jgi:TolB protein
VAWLRDGSLAFAAVVRSGDDASSEIFLQRTPDQPPQRIAGNDEHFVIYLYGSPTPCSGRSGCPALAYLIEEENGVGLRLVVTEDGVPQDLLVAVGRPFYLSWSPDGERILWHTGGALRDNPAAEIGLYHVMQDRRRVLPFPPGTFLAPAWSGQSDYWLGVTGSDGANRFQHIRSDEAETLVATAGREIVFVPAPDGRRVAYAVRDADIPAAYGPVHVVDLETGKTIQLTDDAFAVLGFFWSPDGGRIAYLSRLELPDSVWMQWRVFDPESGRDRGFAAFHPSPLMRFMIHSFNQYAQSHRFWSPDGRYLVYAERDDAGADRVWLVDTEGEKGSDPVLVDEGSIGVWSWR